MSNLQKKAMMRYLKDNELYGKFKRKMYEKSENANNLLKDNSEYQYIHLLRYFNTSILGMDYYSDFEKYWYNLYKSRYVDLFKKLLNKYNAYDAFFNNVDKERIAILLDKYHNVKKLTYDWFDNEKIVFDNLTPLSFIPYAYNYNTSIVAKMQTIDFVRINSEWRNILETTKIYKYKS